ncbi:MAG: hypothetical protein JWN18_31 [Parcubacteria group bacterium]|nr:hypothetical protein [Parcubacteria group bacterium]
MTDLISIARSFFVPGKGILAADESVHSATARLASYGIEAGEEMRRQYRDLFLSAPGAEDYLSGVILFSETLEQKGNDKKLFSDSLAERGIFPGIKVDLGTEPISTSPQELITQGLLDLPERLIEYKKQGAVFTKWRAVIRIDGDELPTASAIHENAKRLASYAKDVQMAGLVPILEPEVLHEGKHSRQKAKEVLVETLGTLFSVLEENAVDCSGVILKTSMAISGDKNQKKDLSPEVAEDTIAALMECVPRQVPGIVFLSGGQSTDEATVNLAAIVAKARELQAPWPLTFSYARALQDEALSVWQGKEENKDAARKVFIDRLKKVSAAVR